MNLKEKLPTYEPPNLIWDQIESRLDQPVSLKEAMEDLPDYDPPMDLWNDIQVELISNQPTFKKIKFAWRAVAAVFLVGVSHRS